jgi:Leucine-rich repeat (LRR) protein
MGDLDAHVQDFVGYIALDAVGIRQKKLILALSVLNVSGCSLTELPKDLSYATSLKAFVASHNSISSPSLSHLASLTELNTLILSNNSLTSFPSALTGNMKQLKKLNLSNNQLSSNSIPSLGALGALEELRLNGNPGITTIPEGIDALDNLSILELSTTVVSDWQEVDKLAVCKSLVNLGLRATKLAEHKGYRDKVRNLSCTIFNN